MYIDTVPNRNSPPAFLLRESWREGTKTRKRTVANLSKLPPAAIDALRRILRGEALVSATEMLEIERSLPHGHVAAVLGTLRHIGLDSVIASRRSPERDRVLGMIAARVLNPASKLATARGLGSATSSSTLAEELSIADVSADDLYAALDWLAARQPHVEEKLARKHLDDGALLLYDVTSSYFEGHTSALGQLGHNRDQTGWQPQIVIGLLCARDGCPVAVEVFPGNTSDPKTLSSAVSKARDRFGVSRVVFVGDRGLLTEARIDGELRGVEGLGWITALRAPAIQKLVESGDLQLSLFDERDLCEIKSDEYPGERLVACRNPLLAGERSRKRSELLALTERELERIRAATVRKRSPLVGSDKIGVRLGRVVGRFKMGKHFHWTITDTAFSYTRDEESIGNEAALDGIYIIRTSVPVTDMSETEVVSSYKSLSQVERAFRTLKSVDLEVRPIYHRKDERIRAHVLLCMLAYYVVWHMQRALAPLLFADEDPKAGRDRRASVVAPARRSESAERKVARKKTEDGWPVHSFRTLLRDLATLTKNRVRFADSHFDQLATATPIQRRALELLGVHT